MATDQAPELDSVLVFEILAEAGRVWLFLDYDGTLADFAPTPDHILPDQELIDLLTRLSQSEKIRISVVSGRRLSHIQALLPVPRLMLAGTYGIELQTPDGKQINLLDLDELRPALDSLKQAWQALLNRREGFYLEDKGWALAIHARYAEPETAERVLNSAAALAAGRPDLERFRLVGGHKFLEITPKATGKGRTVEYLLDHYPIPGAALIFIGDDDKDEQAFEVIRKNGGIAIVVSPHPRQTHANYRLPSPQAVRAFLEQLAKWAEKGGSMI